MCAAEQLADLLYQSAACPHVQLAWPATPNERFWGRNQAQRAQHVARRTCTLGSLQLGQQGQQGGLETGHQAPGKLPAA